MQKAVAFKRTTMSEPSVAEQLNEYIIKNECRVIGFQAVKERPTSCEEWLMAIVDDYPKVLLFGDEALL